MTDDFEAIQEHGKEYSPLKKRHSNTNYQQSSTSKNNNNTRESNTEDDEFVHSEDEDENSPNVVGASNLRYSMQN